LNLCWVLLSIKCLAYTHSDNFPKLFDDGGINYEPIRGRGLPRSIAIPQRLSNASQTDIQRARALVEATLPEAEAINSARLGNPARNRYSTKGASTIGSDNAAKPLLGITDELADAAALVSEADSFGFLVNGTRTGQNSTKIAAQPRDTAAATFWMSNIKRQGAWPWGKNPSNFTVQISYSQ
jgi:hypothetical protein